MIIMAENKLEVTHLLGKKLDKPIIMKWKSETKKNKMEQVAAMFGKRLNERFTIDRKGYRFQARFTSYGLDILGEWDNPYIDVNANVLQDLLTGEEIVIDEV